MTDLNDYLQDGADRQSRAVMCLLQGHDNLVEDSWSDDTKRYEARFTIGRWENCREQGYVIAMRSKDYQKQLNIAFFTHRNSDSICAVKWEQCSINALTIDTAEFGEDVYKDKYDVSKSLRWNQVIEMADWIQSEFEKFWKHSQKKEEETT